MRRECTKLGWQCGLSQIAISLHVRLNPETRKMEAKTSYCLAADGVVVFCGVYQ